MSAAVIGLVLCAAALHASWNAMLRSGADRLWSITVMSLAMALIALPFTCLLPLPLAESWPYIALSATLQIGYSVFLAYAYDTGELGQVYPIVRGSVPLLVTLASLAFTHQRPSLAATAGITLVSLGIISLAFGKGRAAPRSVGFALITGLFIASYVTLDGIGVRLAGNAIAYAAWVSLLNGLLMPLAFMMLRGRLVIVLRAPETWKAATGGAVSLIGYAAVISALALGSVGPIAALRETSIVFSALIGRLVLQEALTGRRVLVCMAVACGAVCIALP
jgi:drug/metabolite transporter (DMT)-like permease